MNEEGKTALYGDGLANYLIFDTDNNGIAETIDETGLRTALVADVRGGTGFALLDPLADNYENFGGNDKIVNSHNQTFYSIGLAAYADAWIYYKWVIDYETGNPVWKY